MNTHILKVVAIICCIIQLHHIGFTQNTSAGISMHAVVQNDNLPESAVDYIETRLQGVLAANGVSDLEYCRRFVLVAKVNLVSSDVVPSNPPRVSKKMDVTFIVGDIIENKTYGSCVLTVSGIGANDAKAYISAFSKINPQNKDLLSLCEKARTEIVAYYSQNCRSIISNAQFLARQKKYDEAIARLMSVPEACQECYEKCRSAAEEIYMRKNDSEYSTLLNEAKNVWMKSKNAAAAETVSVLIGRINPDWTGYPEVISLRKEISAKLSVDEKREWEFRLQQYNDRQAFRQSIVEACRAIGVAWGEGQPEKSTEIIKVW